MFSFVREALRDYFRRFERSSLDELAKVAGEGTTLEHALYGRNGAAKGSKPGESCDPEESETWHLTGYDSLAAILDAAIRHGHESALRWIARVCGFALDIVPWWIARFGKPPGEDARFEPCQDRDELEDDEDGDTDFERHRGDYGLLLALIAPEVRRYGSWTDADVKSLALTLLSDIQAGAIGTVAEKRREFLRYGNRISTLAGICKVFRSIGEPELETVAYNLLKSFVYWAFDPANLVRSAIGTDGRPWAIYCYGDMTYSERTKSFRPCFPYGWYAFGDQAWYLGHQTNGLVRAAEVASLRQDKAFFGFLSEVFRIQTRWIDPLERRRAPMFEDAPPGTPTRAMVSNAIIQGGKRDLDQVVGPMVTDRDIKEGTLLRVADYEALKKGETFCRTTFVDYHEGDDDPYWSTVYTDPVGGQHRRTHGSRDRGPSLPPTDLSNPYACVDAILFRGLSLGNQTIVRHAEIKLGELLAFCNVFDKIVDVGRALDPDKGMHPGLNRVGRFARDYHWAWQIGYYTRRILVGTVGTDAVQPSPDAPTIGDGGSLER